MSSSLSFSSCESGAPDRQENLPFRLVAPTDSSVDDARPRAACPEAGRRLPRADDSERLAQLLLAAEPLIRSRLRRRRAGADASDGAWSTSDAFSSVLRRFLAAGRGGNIRCMQGSPSPEAGGGSMRAIWSFVDSIVQSVAGDVGRRRRRLRRQAGAALDAFRFSGPRSKGPVGDAPAHALARTLESLDPLDRSIILLRLRGNAWASVAAAHGIKVEACRQRWSRSIARIRAWPSADLAPALSQDFRDSGDFPVTAPGPHPTDIRGTSESCSGGVP